MKFLKYTLKALATVLIVRELIGLYEWFVMDGKSWADLKKLTRKEAQVLTKESLDEEFHHPIRHYGEIFRHMSRYLPKVHFSHTKRNLTFTLTDPALKAEFMELAQNGPLTTSQVIELMGRYPDSFEGIITADFFDQKD